MHWLCLIIYYYYYYLVTLRIKTRISYTLGYYNTNEPHSFLDRVSLCIPGQPISCYIDQADLKLRAPPVCFPNAGIKSICHHILPIWIFFFWARVSSSLCWPWTHCVAGMLLSPPPNCLDYRCTSLCLFYLSILSVLFPRTVFVILYLEVRVCYSVCPYVKLYCPNYLISLAQICGGGCSCMHTHWIAFQLL